MTPVQAKLALSRPLVFGDQEQLQARAVMEQVEQVVRAILKCNHYYEAKDKRKKLCSCLSSFPFEFLKAAALDERLSGKPDHALWIHFHC